MDWDDTTIRTIEFGKLRKIKGKNAHKVTYTAYEVPAVYHRLIRQLVAEDRHGQHHHSHESRRRQMYARQVLDNVAEEMIRNAAMPPEKQISPTSFRSHTLTPILQRQLRAVHDAYTPSVHTAMIRKGEASLTIFRATEIYLHEDPARSYLTPRYRRHLLYVPEPRWHLGIVINPGRLEDTSFYNAVREHHEEILMAVRQEIGDKPEYTVCDAHGMPVLRRAEVRAIILEGLEDFFAQELSAVVFHHALLIAIHGANHLLCRVNYWMK